MCLTQIKEASQRPGGLAKVCMHAREYACMYVCVYIYIYIYICVINVYMCVCVSIHSVRSCGGTPVREANSTLLEKTDKEG